MKSVTLTLEPSTQVVEGKTNEQLLENAILALSKQLASGDFRSLKYSISDADALSFETVKTGLIVECNGDLGIVTAVNKKTINVTYTGHRNMQGPPQTFKKSNATFEEARSFRRSDMQGVWLEGDSGYIKTSEGIKPVVVGKKHGNKIKLHVVNTLSYVSLDVSSVNVKLKENKKDFT